MPSVPQITRFRRRRAAQAAPTGRLGFGCSLAASLSIALTVFILAGGLAVLGRDLPPVELIPGLIEPPDGLLHQPTRFYDRTGRIVLLTLESPAAAQARDLTLTERADASGPPQTGTSATPEPAVFPTEFISATLAAADPGFWQHAGFDWLSALNQSPDKPAPTLAQSLVADLLLWNEPPGLARALRERILAAQLTSRFGRSQVLEWYLNNAHYGPLLFGADAAAVYYFDKSAAQLTLSEAAWLAAAAQAPNLVAGLPQDERIARRDRVIDTMYRQGFITANQAASVTQEPLVFAAPPEPPESELAPRFVELALEELTRDIDRTRLERGGLRILTTLDANLQNQAACTTGRLISLMQPEQGNAQNANASPCPAADLLPAAPVNEPGGNLAAAVVILEPKTGQVLALTEAPQPGLDPFEPPGRPAGTLLTPFIYLTAFTQGLSPGSLVWDLPLESDLPAGENLEPSGTGGSSTIQAVDWSQYHGPVRLRMALANDYLSPAYQLVNQLSPENLWRTTDQLGLETYAADLPEGSASDFSQRSVSLLDISHTWGAIANRGSIAGQAVGKGSPAEDMVTTTVLRAESLNGQIWLDRSQPQSRLVISPQLAYLLTHVLSDEAARWPSLGHPNLLEIGRPAAVKAGQPAVGSHPGNDVWTIGATPQRVVGVWIGREFPSDESGAGVPPLKPELAMGLWRALTEYAHLELPAEDWSMPLEVSELEVCDPSGLLPDEDCPTRVREVFLAGSEPTQPDTLYQTVPVDRETGRLATVFTPPEQIEPRLFLTLPPGAHPWAQANDVPLMPETYAVVDFSRPGTEPNPAAQITEPAMFAYVSGLVPIEGWAAGEDFAFYRVQVGQGLYPQNWLQVGEDNESPVSAGRLAEWDTTGLNGLYALQLRVVREDQTVDTQVILVTVDNTPPSARILYPGPDDSLDPGADGELIFQVEASDDLALQSVLIFIDDQLVITLEAPPYAFSWPALEGEHELRVRAVDRAGNFTEDQVEFSIP